MALEARRSPGRQVLLALACALGGAAAPTSLRASPIPVTEAAVHGRGTMRLGGGVRFLTLAGTYREMGEQYGALMQDRVAPQLDQNESPLDGLEREHLEEGLSPRYLELLRGVAAGLEVSYDRVLRTVFHLHPPRGAAVVTTIRGKSGRVDLVHARNLDLAAFPAGDAEAVVEFRPVGELRFLATMVLGLADGMNERGMSVSLATGPACPSSSPARSGVPRVTGEAVDILATARSARQADALVHGIAGDAAILLVGSALERKGTLYDLACGAVRRTRLRGSRPLVATEAYQHPDLAPPASHLRQAALEERFARPMATADDVAASLGDADDGSAPNNAATRRSVIYAAGSRVVRLAIGDNHAAWGRWIEYDWLSDQPSSRRPAPFDVSRITLVTWGAEYTASIRTQVQGPVDPSSLLDEMEVVIRGANLREPLAPYTVYHGKIGDLLDIEAVQSVSGLAPDQGRVRFTAREPTLVASVTHRGPSSTWERAHAVLYAWLDENGYAAAGPLREVYTHGAWDHREPDRWETDFVIPVVAREPNRTSAPTSP